MGEKESRPISGAKYLSEQMQQRFLASYKNGSSEAKVKKSTLRNKSQKNNQVLERLKLITLWPLLYHLW